MTSEEFNAAIATFDSYAAARIAADAAMPRRKHNRPYPVESGYHSARSGHRTWLVIVSNTALMADGTMYDHARKVTIRP